jgi:hypothetical protein
MMEKTRKINQCGVGYAEAEAEGWSGGGDVQRSDG